MCWKLIFPRVGDTMFTVDKLMDINVWKELYNILQRISLKFDASAPSSSLGQQLMDKNRFMLSFTQLSMNNAHLQDIFNIDVKLISAILCADLTLVNNKTGVLPAIDLPHLNGSPGDSSHHKNGERYNTVVKTSKRRFSESTLDTRHWKIAKTHSLRQSIDSSSHTATKINTCLNSDLPSSASKSPSKSEKENVQPVTQSTTHHLTNKASRYNSQSTSSNLIASDNDSSSESVFQTTHYYSTITNSNSMTTEVLFVPQNLVQLHKIMSNNKYLKRFGNESIHDGKMAVFHSGKIIEMINGQEDCQLFFYFSPELLAQCQSFSQVKLADVARVLMVFWSYMGSAFPFAFFLLNDNPESLRQIPNTINKWLKAKVTECITPYSITLHRAIAEVWPQSKIIGCSAQYHRGIRFFARENERFEGDYKLTKLARSLCFLEEKHFSIGINVIKKYTVSDYGVQLVQHLRTKWLRILKSVRNEVIVHRSLTICKETSKRIEQDYFRQCSGESSSLKVIHKNIWDFINFLKSFMSETVEELRDLRQVRSYSNYGLKTTLEKERQRRYTGAMADFNVNLKTMSEKEAVERFMLEISENFPVSPDMVSTYFFPHNREMLNVLLD